MLAHLCDVTGLPPSELRALDGEDLMMLEAWQEGRQLAEWAAATRQARTPTRAVPDSPPPRGGFYR